MNAVPPVEQSPRPTPATGKTDLEHHTISDESEPNEKNLAGATIARQCSARISKDGK
jgi:hypothetical protein